MNKAVAVVDKASWGFRHRGWIGIIFLLPAFVITIMSAAPPIEDSWLDLIADTLGWVVFVAGAGLRLWSTLYIGARKRSTLVSEGPYSICRNPLYVGSFLIAFSIGLFLESLTFLGGVVLSAVAYAVFTIPQEERALQETLGEEYRLYCERVPRFWPRWSQFHTPEVIEVKVKGLKLECARAARWIWVPVILEIIAFLRVQPWWPHLVRHLY